ncbi:MAG: hypothetical protein MZV70_20840 [Desulfobacterales bacterium]|nr:hypothetical protein [Desulfobacterales bacterium]
MTRGATADPRKEVANTHGVFDCPGRQGRHRKNHPGRPVWSNISSHTDKTPVLAVDADSNSNLNEVLGVAVGDTLGNAREDMKKGDVPAA